MAQEYPSSYVGRSSAPCGRARGSCLRATMRRWVTRELIARVDANLMAFGRHIASSIPAGSLEERGDLLLIAGDDPTPVIVNSAFATGPPADPATMLPAVAAFFGRLGHEYGLWTRAHADAALEAVFPAAGLHDRHRPAGDGPRGASGRRSRPVRGRGPAGRRRGRGGGLPDRRPGRLRARTTTGARRSIRRSGPRRASSIRRWPGSSPTWTASLPPPRCRSRIWTSRASAGSGRFPRSAGVGSGPP